MDSFKPLDWELYSDVSGVMEIREWGYEGSFICFRGRLKIPASEASRELNSGDGSRGLITYLRQSGGEEIIKFAPINPGRRKNRLFIPILLFLVTLISTLFVGALNSGTFARDIISHPLLLLNGAPFSFTLIIILGLHEFSHYFVSKRYGIRTSLPYFILFPNIIGTMGAVIVSRSPFVDRKSLFDVGIAGPLASFVLSIGAIILGFSGMTLVRIYPDIFRPEPGLYLGDSLLTTALFWLRYHPIPVGFDVNLGPIGFAGWVGLFVTGLNLLPMGQLDGGHISYALFGRYHKLITRLVLAVLVLLGILYSSPFWIVIGILILFLGSRHGPPLDDITPLNPGRVWLAVAALIILIICFIPVPIRIV